MVTCYYTSEKTGERLHGRAGIQIDRCTGRRLVKAESRCEYQEMLGFGGAFTDTAAAALSKMKPHLQRKAIELYFDGEKGLAYNMGRIPIGCCDFSSVPYSCAEHKEAALSDFSLEQDKKGIIPLLKSARALCPELLCYALPWSPPGWMKTNGQMNFGGRLKEEHYQTMADYLVRFLQGYREEGIDIWGIAPQNEPVEIQRWASCEYTGEQERRFLKDYLIPALKRAGLGDRKILFWDCNKDSVRRRTEEIMADETLAREVYGAAFHWYSGDFFEELGKIHERYPQLKLLSTESCVVLTGDFEDWSMGERYAHDIIGDINQWTSAYLDWNLFLDIYGGPGIAENYCAAPILLDWEAQCLRILPSYYYIGHFSKFIRRGSRRICTESSEKLLECTGVKNPDGTVAVIIMNRSGDRQEGFLELDGIYVPLTMSGHSIMTVVVKKE